MQTSAYYCMHLAPLHQQLLTHPITQTYLSGNGIRYDGVDLTDTNVFEFPFGTLSTLELAHLFSIFDRSRVHSQAQYSHGADDAPPGLYFTVVNTKLLQGPHKNKSGIFVEETDIAGLHIDGLHIDHFFLNKQVTPPMLGTIAFALCAMTAHLAGLQTISLIAAGGKGITSGISATNSGQSSALMPRWCLARSTGWCIWKVAGPCRTYASATLHGGKLTDHNA